MSRDPLILGHVVGDVLDPFARSVSLGVTYKNRLVINGSEFKPSAVVDKPLVQVGGDDLRIFYTLVSSSSSHRLHPGSASNTLRESIGARVFGSDVGDTGREIVCYECPRPASGIHRVVLVLLRQIGRETVFTPEMRHNFSTRRFAMEHYLVPVAATYYNCQREAGTGGRRFIRDDRC
ncbi:Phosphatidylethanolamine-binding protein [Musa troglodytarum]|uniref:Phosphatidylethanolamine-binding protein n=1 Tax=Musa troglodytarum TaxID=320322 RepID=A0A9E7EY78_9LILI|nr:Phosphatidylethanolamine-binding protein [Musa troglodytarum]